MNFYCTCARRTWLGESNHGMATRGDLPAVAMIILYNQGLSGKRFEMVLPGNPRVGGRPGYSWRSVLVVFAICFLTINVVTRYSVLGSEAPRVRAVSAVKAQSQECRRQRLLGNGFHWISPTPSATFFQPPRASVHAVSAIFPAINLESESWLYNRPPPSC